MTKKPGRPAAVVPDTTLPALNEARVAEATAALDALDAAESSEDAVLSMVAQAGAIAMATAMHKQLEALTTAQLANIKETKSYKRLRGKRFQLGTHMVTLDGTWDSFCEALSLNRQAVDERIALLPLVGEEALGAMERAGLTRRHFRELRALPAPKIEEILGRVVNTADPEELREVIDEVVAEQQRAERELDEARADLEAKDHLLDEKNKKIDSLSAKRKHKLSAAGEARAAMCEAVAEQAGAIAAAAAQLDELLTEAGDQDMLTDVDTQERLFRAIHVAHLAFAKVYASHGVCDVDDLNAAVFGDAAPASAGSSTRQ